MGRYVAFDSLWLGSHSCYFQPSYYCPWANFRIYIKCIFRYAHVFRVYLKRACLMLNRQESSVVAFQAHYGNHEVHLIKIFRLPCISAQVGCMSFLLFMRKGVACRANPAPTSTGTSFPLTCSVDPITVSSEHL